MPAYTTCWVDIPVMRALRTAQVFTNASRNPPLPCICANQRAAVAAAGQFKPVYFLHLSDQDRQVMRVR